MHHFFFILVLLFLTRGSYGQTKQSVYYHLDKTSIKLPVYKDSVLSTKNHDLAIFEFKMNGYIDIYPKDTLVKKKVIHYYFGANKRFNRVHLQDKSTEKQKIIVKKDLNKAFNEINNRLKDLENHGFPFATIKILEQIEKKNTLLISYKIDSGSFYIIDKIHIKSKTPFHEKTILNSIGIRAGDTYNEEKIKNLILLFQNSEEYSSPRSPELLFRKDKAELFIYIEKKKSSNADGYIGFQQDKITEKLTLNGFVSLELKNSLNRTEVISLNWKNNPDKTQNLKAFFEYPYLFGSPIGIGSNINLQKQDTSFVRSDLMFELTYRNPIFRISIFDQIETSSTLTKIPINGFRNYSKNTIGLTVKYRPFMPERLQFYSPTIYLSSGIFNYRADTLDNEKQKIANNKYLIRYSHKINFFRFFHLNNLLQYQGLSSSIGISRNELIYFGGLKSVRGFYELELAGKENWILQNEIEFTPFESLSLKVLYDYSNFRNDSKHYTHSFGVGFGLINKSNKLEIIVANGRLDNNPFSLNDTKVHLGFTSSF